MRHPFATVVPRSVAQLPGTDRAHAEGAIEIDSEVQRLFGDLTSHRVRTGWDAAGWSSGRRAADRANLFLSEVVAGDARDHEREQPGAQLPLGLAESA